MKVIGGIELNIELLEKHSINVDSVPGIISNLYDQGNVYWGADSSNSNFRHQVYNRSHIC